MKELEKRIKQHLEERGWDHLRPADISKSIMIEGAELLELFQWENRELEDVKREAIAVKEAKKLGIPVVAITDTNVDPTGIVYIIPANDDSVKSLQYIINQIRDSYLKGKELAKK